MDTAPKDIDFQSSQLRLSFASFSRQWLSDAEISSPNGRVSFFQDRCAVSSPVIRLKPLVFSPSLFLRNPPAITISSPASDSSIYFFCTVLLFTRRAPQIWPYPPSSIIVPLTHRQDRADSSESVIRFFVRRCDIRRLSVPQMFAKCRINYIISLLQ